MQASVSPLGTDDVVGQWTDLENGRTDRAIWNLPTAVQDTYYPVMDRYYSIMNVKQQPMTETEEDLSIALRKQLASLNPYSRQTIATAILSGTTEIHTLFAELLSDDVVSYVRDEHDIQIVLPEANVEQEYRDAVLEERYHTALKTFALFGVNPPAQLDDTRAVKL